MNLHLPSQCLEDIIQALYLAIEILETEYGREREVEVLEFLLLWLEEHINGD